MSKSVLKIWVFIAPLLVFCLPELARADWVEKGGLHNMSRSSFTDPTDIRHSDLIDPEEKMRTWTKAVVWVPTGPGESRRVTMDELLELYADSEEKFPTAIYLHGCAGLWSGSSMRMKLLADSGFLAIGPASLAWKKYAQSCNHLTHQGGMFREAVAI